MRIWVLIFSLLPTLAFAEMRCGWLLNPTPANWYLEDRDAIWTLSVQGKGGRDNGFYNADMPENLDQTKIGTDQGRDYYCACIRGQVDPKTNWFIEVTSVRYNPMSQCKNDPAINMPAKSGQSQRHCE